MLVKSVGGNLGGGDPVTVQEGALLVQPPPLWPWPLLPPLWQELLEAAVNNAGAGAVRARLRS